MLLWQQSERVSLASAAADPWSGADVEIGTGDANSGSLTIWDVDTDGSIDHSVRYLDGREYRQVWCGTTGGLMVDDNYLDNETLTIDTDASGDKVISGTGDFSTTSGTLDAEVEYRVYAAGDLLRTSYKLTNNTANPITFTPSMGDDISDATGDVDKFVATTSSGDNQIDLTDNWWSYVDLTQDSNSDSGDEVPSVIFSRFWGTKKGAVDFGSLSFEVIDLGGGVYEDNRDYDDVVFEDITIAPGASYLWVSFYKMDTYVYTLVGPNVNGYESNIASATAVLNSAADDLKSGVLEGRYARNLDLTVANNWGPVELPTTGSDSTGLALAGLALAIMGGAVLVRRRATV